MNCGNTLVDRPFATKEESLFCSDCYDDRFAARCDGCKNVFKAGMRKYEYRGKQWHEECFLCLECKNPIGSKSFIPREDAVCCIACYEKKYAQKCNKCKEVRVKCGEFLNVNVSGVSYIKLQKCAKFSSSTHFAKYHSCSKERLLANIFTTLV